MFKTILSTVVMIVVTMNLAYADVTAIKSLKGETMGVIVNGIVHSPSTGERIGKVINKRIYNALNVPVAIVTCGGLLTTLDNKSYGSLTSTRFNSVNSRYLNRKFCS